MPKTHSEGHVIQVKVAFSDSSLVRSEFPLLFFFLESIKMASAERLYWFNKLECQCRNIKLLVLSLVQD